MNIEDSLFLQKRENDKLRKENERLKEAIRIYNIYITSARKATSLGLCKRSLINGLGHVKKALEDKGGD